MTTHSDTTISHSVEDVETTSGSDTDPVVTAIERLNDAVNAGDVKAVLAAMTEDCVFESTLPPDGDRYEGHDEVGAFFRRLFASARQRKFDAEEVFTAGDRAVVLCTHTWVDLDGHSGHVRSVDIFRVHDGKVAEKLSYVKG